MKLTVSRAAKYPTHIVLLPKGSTTNIPDFEGASGDLTVRYDVKTTLIYVGCGDKADAASLRAAAGNGIRAAQKLKRTAVSIIPAPDAATDPLDLRAIAEGAFLGAYLFEKYRSEKKIPLDSIDLVSEVLPLKEFKRLAAIADCVAYARDLINTNASEVYPETLAVEAKKIAAAHPSLKATVLNEKDLVKQGLGLLTAVGQGSPFPPRLIVLEYTGDAKSKKKTAIVGKGVTFDSGGQNLKPSGSIETMREDMSGAAATLAILRAAAELALPLNIVGVIPAAHNAIGTSSYFPGDIYRSYAGKTVEILNTDAEGRLILADALAFCIKNYKPSEIIDMATLTGAIVTALGGSIGGLFSNNDELAAALFGCGERAGERLWRMPIYDEHRESMKGDIADMRNMSKMKKGSASSLTAAAFLQAFVDDVPWAHLDIAGVAWNEGEATGELPKYGTGFGVRLLLEYLTGKNKGLK